MKPAKKIIGRREVVDFPELELMGIDAKIDTGAYTSSIHCKDVKAFVKNGREFVSFILLDEAHPQYNEKVITCPVYKFKAIKNSFGQVEERYSIQTQIALYNEIYGIELTLADRSEMEFPVLLGRKALSRRFVVDVVKVNCALKNTNRKLKKSNKKA